MYKGQNSHFLLPTLACKFVRKKTNYNYQKEWVLGSSQKDTQTAARRGSGGGDMLATKGDLINRSNFSQIDQIINSNQK